MNYHYRLFSLLVFISVVAYAADDMPLSVSIEQAATETHPLVTQLKDLIYNAGPSEALQQYKAQLKDVQDQVLQEVRDAVDAYDTGITVAYDIHKDPCMDTLMGELLRTAASPKVQWDGKKLKPIAEDYLEDVKTWETKTYDRINTLLNFLRNHGELGWRHFEHFRTEMNVRPFVDREKYLDTINERIEDLKKTVKDINTEREWKAHNNLVLGTLGLVEGEDVGDEELDCDEEILNAVLKESGGWPENRRAANFILNIKRY